MDNPNTPGNPMNPKTTNQTNESYVEDVRCFPTYKECAEYALEDSKNGYVQHVEKHGNHFCTSDWYDSDSTVGSFSNGRHIGGRDINEQETANESRLNENQFKDLSDAKLKAWLTRNSVEEPGIGQAYGQQIKMAKQEWVRRFGDLRKLKDAGLPKRK
jgi:hypothetical protein